MNLEEKAKALATKAHEGQIRKFTGESYISHPEMVSDFLKHYYGITIEQICAGWLHDVLEDTSVTYDDIVNELNQDIADIVVNCTDTPGLKGNARRKAKLEFIKSLAIDNPARVVMLEDVHANMYSLVPLAADHAIDFTSFSAGQDIIYYYKAKAEHLAEGMRELSPKRTMDEIYWAFNYVRDMYEIVEQSKPLW